MHLLLGEGALLYLYHVEFKWLSMNVKMTRGNIEWKTILFSCLIESPLRVICNTAALEGVDTYWLIFASRLVKWDIKYCNVCILLTPPLLCNIQVLKQEVRTHRHFLIRGLWLGAVNKSQLEPKDLHLLSATLLPSKFKYCVTLWMRAMPAQPQVLASPIQDFGAWLVANLYPTFNSNIYCNCGIDNFFLYESWKSDTSPLQSSIVCISIMTHTVWAGYITFDAVRFDYTVPISIKIYLKVSQNSLLGREFRPIFEDLFWVLEPPI